MRSSVQSCSLLAFLCPTPLCDEGMWGGQQHIAACKGSKKRNKNTKKLGDVSAYVGIPGVPRWLVFLVLRDLKNLLEDSVIQNAV